MAEEIADAEGELAAAIAENPDAVADLVRRLDAVNELLDVLALGEGALTDEMVRELSGTSSTLAESADAMATEETVGIAGTIGTNGAALDDALESLVTLQQSGTLDELMELAGVLSLLTAALDDEMVRSLAATGSSLGEVAESAADENTRDGIQTTLTALGEADGEPPERVGPVGLLKASREPEVQHGLGYLVAVARAIGRTQSADESE
ncbi:MAG: DUF1641 domain-containing protein [Halolamina sp.]|uniref:DUF1641 domain-containing protein n=1 Tax=Halolamina sp. TaxID=1940283 RepID=UPI002FC33A41